MVRASAMRAVEALYGVVWGDPPMQLTGDSPPADRNDLSRMPGRVRCSRSESPAPAMWNGTGTQALKITTQKSFGQLMKRLLDRICDEEDLSRPELAESLDVHPQTLSTAAYRGEIGFDLMLEIARRADASAKELMELEVLWLQARSMKPRDEALRRSMQMTQTLFDELERVEEWLNKRGHLDAYLKSRKRRTHPLEERSQRVLDGDD